MRKRNFLIAGSVLAGLTVLALLIALSFLWGRLTSSENASRTSSETASTARPAPATSGRPVESTQVTGELVRKDPNSYVIRDTTGREFRLRVNRTTTVEEEPKIGDRVIARVDPRPSDVYVKSLGVRPGGRGMRSGATIDQTTQKAPAGLDVIEGEVLRLDGQTYVVKDLSGREVRLRVDEHTKKDGNVTVGDRVVANTDAGTEPGYTVSLSKR